MKVRRFDTGMMRSPVKLPNGWLKADGYLTRIGVFAYTKADGSQQRELRLPEEVFSDAAIESFRMVPLTGGHPVKEPGGMLTADNTAQYQRGSVGERLYPEGGYLRGPVMITDAAAIKEVEAGAQELSCGYHCELEQTSGVWNGQPYDVIQRNIIGNHVAYLKKGRAGPEVRLHLDAADAIQIETPQEHTVQVRLDGIPFEIPDSAAAALEKERAGQQAKLDAATATAKKAESEAAQAQAKLDAAEAKVKELSDPKALQARVSARASLEVEARAHLGADIKLDAMEDHAVKLEVLKKLRPDAKLDGKSTDYVAAYYDSTIQVEQKKTPALDAARRAADGTPSAPSPRADASDTDADAARKRMVEANRKAWESKV